MTQARLRDELKKPAYWTFGVLVTSLAIVLFKWQQADTQLRLCHASNESIRKMHQLEMEHLRRESGLGHRSGLKGRRHK